MVDKFDFILADDHPLFRKALLGIIEKLPCTNKVFEAKNGEGVLAILEKENPEIIIMDYSMPGMNGYDTAKFVMSHYPGKKIIILTQYDEIPVILNFFKIGARGFLTKNAGEKEIMESIDLVVKGNYYYHSRFEDSISRWLAEGLTRKIPAITFSKSEMTLIALMSKGKTSQEISEVMGLSIRSVETYRHNLLKSLKVSNTMELLAYVYKNGIVD